MNLRDIQQSIETTIDTSATTAEEYHRQFADQVLHGFLSYMPMGDAGEQLREFQEQSSTGFYGAIKSVNNSSGEMTRSLLDQIGQ